MCIKCRGDWSGRVMGRERGREALFGDLRCAPDSRRSLSLLEVWWFLHGFEAAFGDQVAVGDQLYVVALQGLLEFG
jgi:hypothetical protein